jgi:hypothetical protein
MPLYLFTSVDNPISAPEREIAATVFAQLGEVRWFDGEITGHDAIALPIFPMADSTVALILKLPTANDFTFLRQTRDWQGPEQDRDRESSEASPLVSPSVCPSNDLARL